MRFKNHGEGIDEPSVEIYVNKIENRITLKIKDVYCFEIFNNDYQQHSIVLYRFVPNKPFGSLLEISQINLIFLKTFNSE